MFSFHKPRVYRSAEGCCICRAKSSSSRFTDSRKYEHDSMKCFDLKYPRHGEICNACVLLVKRFKRLPVGSTRHWGHVVDARAGPGTKSITKHKKNRDEGGENSPSASNSNGSSASSRRTQNSKSLITEKFSKIFKKSKNKITTGGNNGGAVVITPKKETNVGKRRSSGSGATWKEQPHSLPTTPDSMDSDYEDSGARTCLTSNGSVVQFQTQTRASSYRSRNRSGCADGALLACRRNPMKTGSKRRKCLPPVRNRRTLERLNENVQFFDESEWKERKSCCGMVYECATLTGTLLLDLQHFKPCVEHQKREQSALSVSQQQSSAQELAAITQKVIATLPAVVQLSPPPPTTPPSTAIVVPLPPALPAPVSITVKSNPTPVLKKHHLFFKRQSECFPHGDLNTNSGVNNNNNNNITNTLTKTESFATNAANSNKSNNSTISATAIDNNSTATNVNCSTTSNLMPSIPLPLSINTSGNMAMTSISSIHSPAIIATTQMPRHSTAKVTTISPPATNNNGANKLLHKIKGGKIFKHSLATGVAAGAGVGAAAAAAAAATAAAATIANAERINKPADGHDLKHIVRTVPKSFVLTKPAVSSNQAYTQLTSSTLHYPVGSSPTSTCSNSSTVSSSSSSSSAAPKFSDNSSDSGFDENMQERKSASPLQEDTEKKLAARASVGNVQTMFLASGVQIQGQQQNLMLTGNEVAAKLLQNRKQQMPIVAVGNGMVGASTSTIHQHYQQQTNSATRLNNTTAALKIAQVVGPGGASTSSATAMTSNMVGGGVGVGVGSHTKTTRAIYNNNTIQHENGVTTIVPASSLAASTQTAAMNALAPSTVTITPAPAHHLTGAASLTKKLATSSATLIATSNNNVNNQSNILHSVNNGAAHLNAINSHNNNLLQHQHQHQHQHQLQHPHLHQQQTHHNVNNGLNQKIILVKTTGATKYHNNINGNGSKITSMGAPTGIGASATININGGAGVCKN